MTDPTQDPESVRISKEWGHALERLSDEDKRLLDILRLMGEVADERYEIKGIRLLVGRALVDPAFRSRILKDADSALAELRGITDLPENVRVSCVENSADHLTIVLPPASEKLSERSRKIRDSILSRTSAEFSSLAGTDDNDVLPINFVAERAGPHFGDPSHDGH